ncbi:calpain-9-like [Gigantopelta aegis]|uniref:calpain-9-like n=1 Tax=Gigantopelta aegis TaxID=1735272 RepID=UPI001B88B6B5|nr:calpain-9-like [Gigantopelta aegis]
MQYNHGALQEQLHDSDVSELQHRDRHHKSTAHDSVQDVVNGGGGGPGLRHTREVGWGDPGAGRGGQRNDRDFDRLRTACLKRNVLYQDQEFLPCDTSLYYSRRPPYQFEWKRPWEIAKLFQARPGFFVGGIERFDVIQGSLGDCWLVAAIACLTDPDYRELFFKVVPDNQSFEDGWYTGIFHFNFWHFGKWQEVIIDDLLPTYRGYLRFMHSKQQFEYWPALLEKAYAKLYGSYEALKGGLMTDSLTDLTGGLTESYYLRGKNTNVPRNIVNILFKALDRQSLIGCAINPLDPQSGVQESKLKNGLVAGHAYSVTDLREIQMKSDHGQGHITLIRVRNPWGNKIEWNGPWSDRSAEWLSIPVHLRQSMGLIQRDNGEFWMDFRDFLQNFDVLDICNLSPNTMADMPRQWHVVEHHGKWQKGFNAGGQPSRSDTHWSNPQYFVSLQDTDEDDDNHCSFIIQLMQKDRRKIKQKSKQFLHIGFIIYKYSRSYSMPLGRDFFDYNRSVASCDAFTNSRQVVKRLAMKPGEYVVIPCTYEAEQEADFYIRFFFEKGNVAEYCDEKPTRVDIPLPEPSNEYKEQQERFKQFFYRVAGEDMEVNPFELKIAIDEALQKEPLHKDISIDACKSFVNLMDVDNSGKLGYTEFSYLWNHLRSWKKVFYQFDKNQSGKMNSYELQKAIPAAGFKVNHSAMAALIFRFADQSQHIDLDNFLICMAKLMKLFNVFKEHQQKDQAVFSLQQYLETSLYVG